MNRLGILFVLMLSSFSLFSQSGLYNGLDVKIDYQKSLDNRINQLQLQMQSRELQMQQMQNYQNQMKALKAEQKEKARACALQTKEYYASVKTFPKQIKDGWYNVVVTNNYDFCNERKVYVEASRVKKYFVDNYSERIISFSSPITDAMSHVRMSINGQDTELHDVYFLDNIIDPTASTSKPRYGKFTFYTTNKKAGTVKIYFDGKYAGALTQYFDPKIGTPSCGHESSGTVTFVYKPGTYNFVAQSSNYKWSGQFTIYDDNCNSMSLSK